MKAYRLKITEQDLHELQRLVLAKIPIESGAFALAGIAEHRSGTDIIVRRPISVPQECFNIQEETRLEVSTRAINGLISLCEHNRLGAVLVHSHPHNSPYSVSDDHGERRVFEAVRAFVSDKAPTASLLFYPGGVTGRLWTPNRRKPTPLSEIVVVGRNTRRIRLGNRCLNAKTGATEVYDRQIRAFGSEGQALIADAKVAVVGVGGTGSATAEQLARMGVRDMVLIDHDDFSPSNITRMYGTFARSDRRSWWRPWKTAPKKVAVLARHLKRINPGIRIRKMPKNVVDESTAVGLLDRDMIFLCTDEHWGRSIVNQIAYQYFIPTINIGMKIAAGNGQISAAVGCVDVLRPGLPCLWCREFLRSERVNAESMSVSDRNQLKKEGYVDDIDTPAPSVVSMTTALSAMAVSMFLQIFTDFMGTNGNIARLNYDITAGTVRRGTMGPKDRCVCQKVLGFGDLSNLPTVEDRLLIRASSSVVADARA